MKIGLLVIATGKYINFAQPLWSSVQKYFFSEGNDKVSMFIFTDAAEVPKGTIRFYQRHEKFPAPTLYRYKWFLKQKKKLSKMDYLFYCDVDMKLVSPVGKEILGNRVATLHPGFFDKPRKVFSYEKRKESTAFISSNQGDNYFCGGFNGGRAEEFLKMAEVISRNVNKDLQNGIIAEWHDESHLNRYLIDNKPDKILTPDYCFPEELSSTFKESHPEIKTNFYQWFPASLNEYSGKPKIIALYKNHESVRYSGFEYWYGQIRRDLVNKIVMTRNTVGDAPHVFKAVLFRLMCDHPGMWAYKYYRSRTDETCLTRSLKNDKGGRTIDLVSVGFNNPEVIERQIKLLKKNLKDKYVLLIADNSNDPGKRKKIKEICQKYNTGYISLPENPFSKKPSLGNLSHGSALNWVYRNYIQKRPGRYFGFLDHDVFPYRKTKLLKYFRKLPVFGIKQSRTSTWYLWAGFCFFDKHFIANKPLNFLSVKYGNELLDTGGGNWKPLYSRVDPNKLPLFKHRYLNLTGGNIAQHDMVEFFGDWIHLFNASNWYTMDYSKKIKRDLLIANLIKKYENR